jgi:orotidine-5'-phosphate decarboxylase
MPPAAIEAAKRARGTHPGPRFLTVPFLSSLDEKDLAAVVPAGSNLSVEEYIFTRADAALRAGCDGIIASGEAISVCRRRFGPSVVLVSPGIRPAGSSTDDHKRHTTPADAIRLGADYLVVGRPIVQAQNPRESAGQIIQEIDNALTSVAAR